MRSGGVRCSCTCAVALRNSKDKLTLDDVASWRQTVLDDFQKIKDTKTRPCDDSSVWAGLEINVRAVMGWVLCNKHQAQLGLVVRTTMDSLKKACGPSAWTDTLQNATQLNTRSSGVNNIVLSQLTSPASTTPSVYGGAPMLTPSSSSSFTDDLDSRNDTPGPSPSSHINVHPVLPNMAPRSSRSVRRHAASHLPTPPLSPSSPAQRSLAQPITINNNNTVYVCPATPQQAIATHPLPTSARRAAEAQSSPQAQVNTEVDCEQTKSQGHINVADRELATERHCINGRTKPQASHVFSVRPRTESDSSVSQLAQPKPLKSGLPSSLPYAETDCSPSRQGFLEMKKKYEALQLRDECRQKEFEELKVRFHTTDDRLFESETKIQNLEAQLRDATLRIGELQLENADLKAQGWEEESEGEIQSDEDLDGIP